MSDFWLFLLSLIILGVAVFDDLRSRKIHNQLIIFFIPVALLGVVFLKSWFALAYMSLPSGLLALVLGLPLYFLGVIGGGDLKLYFTVALTWGLGTAFWSFVYALPFGAVLGVLSLVFRGQIKDLYRNLVLMLKFQKPQKTELKTFPFSIALLLGWLTYRVMEQIS